MPYQAEYDSTRSIPTIDSQSRKKLKLFKKDSGKEVVEIGVIKAQNDEKQIVYGEVYIPNRVDTDHETVSKDDVEQMAWRFLAALKTDKIDLQHNLIESGCEVVESFIAREGWKPWVEGAWVLGVKCTDEVWEGVKKGEFNGFSFYGTSQKSPAKVLVEVAKQIAGTTEENTEDILPPHEHTFVVNLDNNGNIVTGKTDLVMEHSHPIVKGTATEEELDALCDQVLEILGETEKAPDVYGQE